jgi:hypothetical protein
MFRPFSGVIIRYYKEIKLHKHKVVRPNGIPRGKTNLMLSKPTTLNCYYYLLDNTRPYFPLCLTETNCLFYQHNGMDPPPPIFEIKNRLH